MMMSIIDINKVFFGCDVTHEPLNVLNHADYSVCTYK